MQESEEPLETKPSTSRDSAERNGPSKNHRKPNRAPLKTTSSVYFQPGRALDLFCDPPDQMLWDEKPLWSPSRMFLDGDDISRSLLSDIRASLATSKSAAYASFLLPSSEPLDSCFSQLPKIEKVAFNDSEVSTKRPSKKASTPLTILKRPTDGSKKLELIDKQNSPKNLDEDAMLKLEKFCAEGDISLFEKALKLCMKSVRLTYYAILDLTTHPEGKNFDVKNSILTNFAQSLERAYLKHQPRKESQEDEISNPDDGVITDKDILLSKLLEKMNIDSKIEEDGLPNQLHNAYKLFLDAVRKHHAAFIGKLCSILGGSDSNLALKRDLSGTYTKLIKINEVNHIPDDNIAKYNAVKPFLYREFMTMAILERIGVKSFKLDGAIFLTPTDKYLLGSSMDIACTYFTKAAITDSTRVSPFDGLSSACPDRSYLTRGLFAISAFIRDPSNHRALSVELKNLSKLYVKFFTSFTLIYDAVFNQSYRHGNPIRRIKNQRWLYPDGVKDPLYDPDPVKRILNHLHRFVDADVLSLFKYYNYWSGLRLLMFIGFKIIDRLDLDQFDEQVQVALYGLSVGFASKLSDNVHLVQLAKFLIGVVTVCEQQKESECTYRTACRLLVEYFALLLQTFNSLFIGSNMLESIKKQSVTDEMMAFLLPITLLTHWLSRSPTFFKHEAWTRKWSFSIAFTADFWPALSTLANNIRLLKNNGIFNAISTSSTTGQIIPEIANSFGVSPIFNDLTARFVVDSEKVSNVDAVIRLFSIWDNLHLIVSMADEQCFVYNPKKGFEGHSDEKRSLVSEPDYFETPKLLPVPLDEIEECVKSRKKEVEAEQSLELSNLIELAKLEAKDEKSILHHKILIIIRPRYLVIDTNSFIDAFDTILSFLEDPYLTVLVPLPVISELKGLRNKKAASPTAQDEDHAKEVSKAAVRSLQILETIKKDNIKLLARKGRMLKMDINYQDISYEAKVNNDRLIIETAKEFSEKICPKSIRVPSGTIWIFRDVLLVTRDRVMMLLANAYRLPSLDIDSFAKWTGF